MWSLLTLLALSPAHAAEAQEVVIGPDHRRLSDELAEVDQKYRRGRSVHRWGNVATGAGLVLAIGGAPLWASAGCSIGDAGCDSPLLAGIGTTLMATGGVAFVGGPVLSNVGALQVAGALRQRGAATDRTPGYLGLGYYGASFVVGPASVALADAIIRGDNSGAFVEEVGVPVLSVLTIASYLSPVVAVGMAWGQMAGPNRGALLGLENLTMRPTFLHEGAGIAVSASF